MENRITELEIRMAYLEQTMSELNDVVIAQRTVLEDSQRQIERLRARLESLIEGQAGDSPDNAPP